MTKVAFPDELVKAQRHHHLIAKKLNQIALGILQGLEHGFTDIFSLICHPLDNLVYPISDLIYDALIIASVHNELLEPHALFAMNSQQYIDASSRMAERINTLTKSCQWGGASFLNAPLQKQVEYLTRTATNILVPGTVFRGLKTIYAGTKNLKSFGTFKNPPLFVNTIPETLNPNLKWSPLTKAQLQSMNDLCRCIYVITEEGELIIAPRLLEQNIFNARGTRLITEIHHHVLGRLRPVVAAGELLVKDGKITLIDNLSGHYLPSGPKLQTVVEHVFQKNGYAFGQYQEAVWTQHFAAPTPKSRPLATGKLYPFTTLSVLVMNNAFNTPEHHEQNPLIVELYEKSRVPIPSELLQINKGDAEKTVCQKIDSYFDDLIKNYSDSTKQRLRDMYYNNTNVKSSQALITEKKWANWSFTANEHGICFEMLFHPCLLDCPVMLRWNKIHEIAIHIGQVCEQIENVGLDVFMDDRLSIFRKFTEQSAALAEKILLDALPENIIKRDLNKIKTSPYYDVIKSDLQSRKSISFLDYLRLPHRNNEDNLTELDHHLFLKNPDVQELIDIRIKGLKRQVKELRSQAKERAKIAKAAIQTSATMGGGEKNLTATPVELAKTRMTNEISQRLKDCAQTPEILQRLSGLLQAHPELNSAAAWYNFAQKNSADLSALCDYLKLTTVFDPNSYTALALLGFLNSCSSPAYEHSRVSRPLYQRAVSGGNSFAHKMLNRPSTTPDRDGDGQYEAIKQSCENRRIQDLIKKGCFDLFEGRRYVGFEGNAYGDNLRLVVQAPSKPSNSNVPNSQNNDNDSRGEHYGSWGSSGSSDLWATRGGANNANSGTGRIPCDHQSSDRGGDLYKCGHMDVRLSGSSRDDTRTLTASNGLNSVRLAVSASRDSGGWISYSGSDHKDVMCVRDRDFDRSGNGFDIGNPHGDAVDRNLGRR